MKLTKAQRRSEKKRKRALLDKARAARLLRRQQRRPQPWKPVRTRLIRAPQLFPPSSTMEDRLNAIRQIGKRTSEEFAAKYASLERWFLEYDAVYVLSYCSFYWLTHPEGVDLEAQGKLEFPPYFVEILQAISLRQNRSNSIRPLQNDAERLKQDVSELVELIGMRHWKIPEHLTQESEIQAYFLRTQIMLNTTAVRNWAYLHQIQRVTMELAELVDTDFKLEHGIGSIEFFRTLIALVHERTEKINEHTDKMRGFVRAKDKREMLDAYRAGFPDTIQSSEVETMLAEFESKGLNAESLKVMLFCHSDLRLPDIFSFQATDVAKLLPQESIDPFLHLADSLSHAFGDLKNTNMDHFILNNPIHMRPFIRLAEGKFFSAAWPTIAHYLVSILEELISRDPQSSGKYWQRRGNYLEDSLEKLLRRAFPGGQVFRGSLWKEPSTDKEYENDFTVICDSFALIVEAKSGGVSDAARRGAPDRLERTVKDLIEEPSDQALRFIAFLKENPNSHCLPTKRGVKNVIDVTKVKYFIPLGVTLAELGMVSGNLKYLVEAGLLKRNIKELAPSVSITDLEIVFDILTSEPQRLHYLARRRELEENCQYNGDEIDILAFYMDHGFNIGEAEFDKNFALNLTGKSKELDPYVIGTIEGEKIPKPRVSMTKWWEDMLHAICSRKKEGWVETAYILLNTAKEDQENFERNIEKLKRRIRKGQTKDPHNWLICMAGPERRRYAIVGYPYLTQDRAERNGMIGSILAGEEFKALRGVVVIGMDMNRSDYPYSVIARTIFTKLFEEAEIPTQTQ